MVANHAFGYARQKISLAPFEFIFQLKENTHAFADQNLFRQMKDLPLHWEVGFFFDNIANKSGNPLSTVSMEVIQYISFRKNEETLGVDWITQTMLKCLLETAVTILVNIFNVMLRL